ncbi:MAG TPA: hypothetical protein VEA99_10375 [Gemmatimonadaceae bacterium]|nr:hypothetical protein [Gemmatimonadaceae bacterium]
MDTLTMLGDLAMQTGADAVLIDALKAALATAELERDEARELAAQRGEAQARLSALLTAAEERAERAERERDEERHLADVRGEMLTKADAGNAALRDNIESFRYRLATIIDEEWGTQPWMDFSTLLKALGERLFEDRLDRERYRAALERIERQGKDAPRYACIDLARAALTDTKETP